MIIKKSKEEILNNMLDNLPSEYDKTEGGLFFDCLAPVSIEFSNFRDIIDFVHRMGFADTAEGIYLEKKAAEVGLKRREAVKSVGEVTIKGVVNTIIPVGTKVSSDTLIFETIEEKIIPVNGEIIVSVKSIEAGSKNNVGIGAIRYFPITTQGLHEVTNLKAFSEGYDTETDDELRARYYIKVRQPATSGNVYHYQHWCLAVPGIGGVKVFPLWNGNGTVKLVLMDINGLSPGSDLISRVREYLEEQRPIGATVTYSAAIPKMFDFNAKVKIDNGTTIETVNKEFENVVVDYFKKTAFANDYISYAKLGNLLLNVKGVLDYDSFKVNDGQSNITLNDEEVPTFRNSLITLIS